MFFTGNNDSDFLIWDSCRVGGSYYYFMLSVAKETLTIQDLAEIKNTPREIITKLINMKGELVSDITPFLKPNLNISLLLFSLSSTLEMKIATSGGYFAYLVRGSKYAQVISSQAQTVSGKLHPQDHLLMAKQNLPLNSFVVEKLVAGQGLVNDVLAGLSNKANCGVLSVWLPESILTDARNQIADTPLPEPLFPAEATPVVQQPPVTKVSLGNKFKNKVVGLLDWGIGRLSKKELYVDSFGHGEEVDRRRSNMYLVGVILTALFVVSVVFGSINQKSKKQQASVQQTVAQITGLLQESSTIATTDMVKARQLYMQAKQLADGIPDKYQTEVSGVRTQLAQLQKDVTKEYDAKITNYLDLNLVEDGFNPDLSCFSGGKLYLARKTLGTGVIFDADTKKKELEFKYNDFGNISRMFCTQDRLYVSGNKSVLEFANGAFREALSIDRDGFVFAAFGQNLYVVDAPNSLIYRYPGLSDGFGEHSLWLAAGQQLDLSDTVVFAIDGSLWIGGSDGNVLKLTQGRLDSFKGEKLDPNFTVTNLVADETLDNIYVFDNKLGMLVIYDKTGVLQAVYHSDELKGKLLLGVSEASKKAILQDGSKLVALELVH